jgi:isopenicillin-N epimerase
MKNLKEYFLLDPEIHFLNHGSFGACPAPVFEACQAWQRRLERQPVLFLGRQHDELLRESRAALGKYLHADPDDLVYIPNATHGVNIVARSLRLGPGDEILASDHEYGACEYTWEFICAKTGAAYLRQPIPLPLGNEDEVFDQFWQGVTPRTRVIFISHITSPTALRLPIEQICRRARAEGILTLIDGAHAPGQVALDLITLDADFYTGNCHKWMLAPKGAAFLHTRREAQHLIEPLVVSWGYRAQASTGSQFVDYLQWGGTKDPCAALSVPAAIRFMEENEWEKVQEACHWNLIQAIEQICALTGLAAPAPGAAHAQMGIAPLPAKTDLPRLKEQLYEDFRVEVPLIEWNGQKFARISIQAYNTQEDIEAFVGGLAKLL